MANEVWYAIKSTNQPTNIILARYLQFKEFELITRVDSKVLGILSNWNLVFKNIFTISFFYNIFGILFFLNNFDILF